MANLSEKIQAILAEGQSDKAKKEIAAKADREGNKGDDDESDPDKDIKCSEDESDDEESEEFEKKPKKFKKDKVTVSEEAIPGIGADLKGEPDYTSGDAAEAKLVKLQKSTQMKSGPAIEKEKEELSGKEDEVAKIETRKIKANQKSPELGKLKEDAFDALFNGESLTEEFKLKAEAIFEAAVSQVAEERVTLLLDEAVEEAKGELVEQIDGYLDIIIEQWMQDNSVALESGIKVDMMSSFMEGMKSVFEQHYIDVPEGKVNVVEEQSNQIAELEDKISSLQEAADKAIAKAEVLTCEAIIVSYQSGLTAIEADKLHALAEHIDFDSEDEFEAKVKALKESYFSKSMQGKKQIQEASEKVHINESYSDVDAVMRVLQQDSLKLIRSSN